MLKALNIVKKCKKKNQLTNSLNFVKYNQLYEIFKHYLMNTIIPTLLLFCCVLCCNVLGQTQFQYQHNDIEIPAASSEEPKLQNMSTRKALDYLENGAIAWSKQHKCVSCHTNGSYMLTLPILAKENIKPSQEIRQFFHQTLKTFESSNIQKFKTDGTKPEEVIYIAIGLASWDKHIKGVLSKETEQALELMFDLQLESGTWNIPYCWPPFESCPYQIAATAAFAMGMAPGWLEKEKNPEMQQKIHKLTQYLKTTPPPHDYASLWLLWASTQVKGLLSEKDQKEIIQIIFDLQNVDGGWSLRSIASPASWGNGKRTEKIRSEPEFESKTSDAHTTGLSVIVLRDAGISAEDSRLQKAVQWIKSNQRVTGRWWTRSLNTDKFHFITYSSTCYSLLALSKCNALPSVEP